MISQIKNTKSTKVNKRSMLFGTRAFRAGASLLTGASVLIAMTASSSALLVTFDMRAVQSGILATDQGANGTSAAWNVSDPHRPFIQDSVNAPGSKLVLQLFAVFSDATPGGDLFQFTQGSVVSLGASGDFLLPNAGTLRSTAAGNTVNNVPGLDAGTSRSGNPVDASGSYGYGADGVSDIGDLVANNSTTSTPAQWFTADSGLNSLAVPASNELLIGEFALTLGPNTRNGNIAFIYAARPRNTGAAALQRIQKFTIDATIYSLNFQGAGTANNVAFTDSSAFQYIAAGVIPEPSAFGMVLLGSVSLLSFRRMGLKKA